MVKNLTMLLKFLLENIICTEERKEQIKEALRHFALCCEPQVGISNGMDERSGVAKFPSLQSET